MGKDDVTGYDGEGNRAQRTYFSNCDAWDAVVETVVASGTGQQCSNLPISDGVTLVIRAHPDNTGQVFIASSKAKAEASDRVTLEAKDSLSLNIQNANLIWWTASAADQKIELIREL